MYMTSYIDEQADSLRDARGRERELLDRSVTLLREAKSAGVGSMAAVQAVHFTSRLWKTLMEDLANDENVLPEQTRASLISIGIWILKQVDFFRREQLRDLDPVIEISEIIRDGMR